MPSPLFKINNGTPGAHHEGDYEDNITLEIHDRTDVHSVQWEFFGRNRSTVVYPAIAPQGQGYIAVFELPVQVDGYGIGLGIRCTINGGVIPGTNIVDPDLTTTSGVYVPSSSGLCPPFVGETYEFDLEFGWGERIIKNQTDTSVGGDLSGTLGFAVLAKLHGVAFADDIGTPTDGLSLTYDAATSKIAWKDPVKIYSDGSAGNLVISSLNETLDPEDDAEWHTISFAPGHTGVLSLNGCPLRCRVLDLRNANAGAINCEPGVVGGILPAGMASTPTGGGTGGGNTPATEALVITGAGGRAGTYQSTNAVAAPTYTRRHRRLEAAGAVYYVGISGSSNSQCPGGRAAGYLKIRADVIITDGTTAAGCIRANGDNGSTLTTGSVDCGGSGGGAGGVVDLECNRRIGATVTNAISAKGGDGGGRHRPAAVHNVLTGGGGDGGLISVKIRGKSTVTMGAAGATASGDTPGPGGACAANL